DPPTTQRLDMDTLVRLDTRDARDNVLTLLLNAHDAARAAPTTAPATAATATAPAARPRFKPGRDPRQAEVDRAVAALLAMRLFPPGVEESAAWQSYYNPDGSPNFVGRYELKNRGVDLLATRFVAQAMLCDAALRGRTESAAVLGPVRRTVAKWRHE